MPQSADHPTAAPWLWVFTLPGVTRPLSMNGQHGNHYAHARNVKQIRWAARAAAVRAGVPPLDRVVIELHYTPTHARRRDPMNLAPTRKAVEDGLVDAGVIPDDTPTYSVPTAPVIDPPSGLPACLWVRVRRAEPDASDPARAMLTAAVSRLESDLIRELAPRDALAAWDEGARTMVVGQALADELRIARGKIALVEAFAAAARGDS